MYCQLKLALVGLCLWLSLPLLWGQPIEIRPEVHFHRRRVILRIDLNEKINQPLVRGVTAYGEAAPGGGLMGSLMRGLAQGDYLARDPDDLQRVLSYDEVMIRLAEANDAASLVGGHEGTPDFIAAGDDFFLEAAPLAGHVPLDGGSATSGPDPDQLMDCEQVVQVVEDWIFDQNRGTMVYQPRYIEMIWTDPMETLPERVVAMFDYEEVLPTLEQATWVNRHNDAQHRNLREIFELHLWHAYVIDISGYGLRSLAEAKRRREAMTEFEHHLWSY